MEKIIDSFVLPDSTTGWEVMKESKEDSKVDGKHILARAVGPSFLVNGASANGRYYKEKLWTNVIKNNKERIANGQMLGTIGHDQILDDQALGEGKASHMISKIFIENGIGMTEILVLGTKTGKELNTLLRAGMKFPVSSRGFGEYDGTTEDGHDIVDPDKFQLECFDFVRTPGVASAVPKVVEELKDTSDKLKNSKESFTMAEKDILESLTKEKMKIQSELESVIDKNQTLAVKLESAEGKLDVSTKEVSKVEEELTSVKESLEKVKEDLKAFEELGDAEIITKALEGAKELSTKVSEFGTVEGIGESLETLQTYEELGSIDAISEILKITEEYIAIGTPDEIQKAFEATKSLADNLKKEGAVAAAKSLAEETGIKSGLAEKLLKSMGKEDAVIMIESLKSKDDNYSLYHKNESDSNDNKDESRVSVIDKKRTDRLFETVGR